MVDKRDVISPTVAVQDNVRFELKSVLESLTRELVGAEKPIFVECPLCNNKASVAILRSKSLQNAKCRYCSAEMKFKIMLNGAYKVRSDLGLEYVVGEKRTFKERAF